MKFSVQEFNPQSPVHQESAAQASQWAEMSGQMCGMSAEIMADNPTDLHAIGENGTPLGHIAVTSLVEGKAVIGGFVVNPEYRGQGIGITLLQTLVERMSDDSEVVSYQAYANNESIGIFRQAGGKFSGFRDPGENGHGRLIVDMTPAVISRQQTAAA